MKKVRGKALALVLSVALVVSSFSAIPAAAASRTITGSLATTSDSVALVNGGTGAGLKYEDFGSDKLAGNTLTTERHKPAEDVKITAISYGGGDRLVKWYDKETGKSITGETDPDNVALELRSSTASGTEELKVLFKGTWTDDKTDTTYTVRGTETITVTVYNLYEAVLEGTDTLDQYTVSGAPETATYYVVRVKPTGTTAEADLTEKLKVDVQGTEAGDPDYSKAIESGGEGADVAYTIKISGSSFGTVAAESDGGGLSVTATQADKPSAGTYTVTATPTYNQKHLAADDTAYTSNASKNITLKGTITKSVSVDDADFVNFGKYSGTTYLYKTTLDKDTKDEAYKVVSGYTFNFDKAATATVITVDGKASVSGINAKAAGKVNLNSGTVGSLVSNLAEVNVGEAKVSSIDFATASETGRTVDVSSSKSSVGDITDATSVTVNAGTVGDVSADTVEIVAQEDDAKIAIGDINATGVTIDSADSLGISTGTIKATADDTIISLSGSAVTVKGIDFDYRQNVSLSFNNFQGTVPAPAKADEDGTVIVTNDPEDDVTVKGDVVIGTISVYDESKLAFDGKVEATSIDGSGSLIVGLNKLYITGDASGVILKLADDFKVGDTAFTAVSDTVGEEDLTTYGFTVSKSEGSKTDTFKISKTDLVGLTFNPASAEIVKDDSQTFTAIPYATGSSLPEGYKIVYSLSEGNDDIFEVVDNGNGTATVKAVGYDDTFAEENRGVLKAELVDENGDVDEDYTAGELKLTAIKTPKTTYKSDTTGNVALGLGQTYQFKITSLDGKPVTFAVASNGATVTLANASGNDYYYKVTGAKVGNYGVYVNADKTPVAVLNITSNVKIDTTTVTIASGKTYQFKVTAPAQPTFQVAGLGTIALAQKIGNDYFYKVTANNVKGGHGVYVNGVRLAIATFA